MSNHPCLPPCPALQVSGHVKILDDCTAEITDFTYDGEAPAAYMWGAPDTQQRDIVQNGERIADMRLTRKYNKETVRCAICKAAQPAAGRRPRGAERGDSPRPRQARRT